MAPQLITGEASLSCPAPPRGCCQIMLLAPPPPSTCSDKGGRGAFHNNLPPSSQCSPEKLKKIPSKSLTTNFLLNLAYLTKNYVIQLSILVFSTLILTCDAKEVFTNQFYVKLDPAHGHSNPAVLAHAIAKRNGFHSLGPVLGSPHEFHFVHHGLPHARHKRSVPHTRKLKTDPQVSKVTKPSALPYVCQVSTIVKILLVKKIL